VRDNNIITHTHPAVTLQGAAPAANAAGVRFCFLYEGQLKWRCELKQLSQITTSDRSCHYAAAGYIIRRKGALN